MTIFISLHRLCWFVSGLSTVFCNFASICCCFVQFGVFWVLYTIKFQEPPAIIGNIYALVSSIAPIKL